MVGKLLYWRRKYGWMGATKVVAEQARKRLGWIPPARCLFTRIERAMYARQRRLDFALFDAKHGTDTCGTIPLAELTLSRKSPVECLFYEAVSPVIFRQFMAALDIRAGDFDFVDYGSGKGRVLMLAAEHGFRKSIGVEFAGELVEAALKNAELFNRGRSQPAQIESLHMDAVEFVLPETPLVIFFYCPFFGAVLDRVLANIKDSLARHPRPLVLVFNGQNTAVIEKFRATGFACREVPLQRDASRFLHYRGLIFTAPTGSQK